MKNLNVKICQELNFTEENINDLMCSALEGGINYWCDRVEMIDTPEGVEFASDSISKGGKVVLYFGDKKCVRVLTLEKFLKGLSATITQIGGCNSAKDFMDIHDADTADMVIQFALFDELKFV